MVLESDQEFDGLFGWSHASCFEINVELVESARECSSDHNEGMIDSSLPPVSNGHSEFGHADEVKVVENGNAEGENGFGQSVVRDGGSPSIGGLGISEE